MARSKEDGAALDVLTGGLWRENPVFVMLLGCCPTLAVTTSAVNAVAMGLSTTFVLVASGLMVSALRNYIPKDVRIASYIVIIATFVTCVDYAIQALSRDVYNALGAFIQLIVVNCIILGRAEAFASRNTPLRSMLDGLGMGLGFTIALLCLGTVRELLGSGSLFGINLFGPSFEPWVVMVLPPGGFIVLALWLMLFNWIRARQEARENAPAGMEKAQHAV
jgi:electron transport complex protein RnfE